MLYYIQLFRAAAAMLVVLFHSAANLRKEKYFGDVALPLERLFYFGGDAGVCFFFVLSGFIMDQVHARDFSKPEKFPMFWRKRILRIYPTYLLVFLLVYLFALLTPSLRESMPTDIFVLTQSLALLPQDPLKVGGTGAPVLIVAWSLQYELFFYALFSLALLRSWLLPLAFTVLTALMGVGAWCGAFQFPFTFLTSHLLLLFGMGIVASRLVQSGIKIKNLRLFLPILIGATALLALAANCLREFNIKVLFDLAYGVVGALLVFVLTRLETKQEVSTIVKRASILGDASYALYLIHFPLIALLSKVCITAMPRNLVGVLLSFGLLVIGSTFVALIFHVLIERPMQKALKGKTQVALV
jgi:exopolysaccharide production protein ExoZ